ncbi:MAG TPA: hypothetical protein VLT59_15250, partial [Steroidobacteraceae bacterium]|nr:hypothetical protein [Steroidobacteraceae bacterium]
MKQTRSSFSADRSLLALAAAVALALGGATAGAQEDRAGQPESEAPQPTGDLTSPSRADEQAQRSMSPQGQMQQMHEQMPAQMQERHDRMQQMHEEHMQQGKMFPPPRQRATQAGEAATASAIVVGEIVDVRDVDIRGPARQTHRLIRIESPNGRTAVVDLGEARSARQIDLERGDRIFAVGKQARLDGRPVLFAKSIGELHSVGLHTVEAGPLVQQRKPPATEMLARE